MADKKKNSVNGLVDTKLTRSEVISLILEEAEASVRNQIKLLEDDIKNINLKVMNHPEFIDVVMMNIRRDIVKNSVYFKLESFQNYNNSTPYWSGFTFSIDFTDAPDWLIAYHEQVVVIKAKISDLNKTLSSLYDKERAKNYILRQSLSGTDEGKEFLKTIMSFSVNLQNNLLGAANESNT